MKNTINFNLLTPACFAISNAVDMDLGVAGNMIQQNIRDGRNTNPGAETLPIAFQPDWAYLHKVRAVMDAEKLGDYNGDFNAWVRKWQENYKALCALWAAKDYDAMVKLMEGASDPGPISGDKPGKEEN